MERLLASATARTSLRGLTAIAIARLDGEGRLCDANEGFWRLIGREPLPAQCHVDIADCFANPPLDELLRQVKATPADEAPLFAGLITLGDPQTRGQTIRGAIHRDGQGLLLIGEYDVPEMERLSTEVLRLNEELAEAQRGLVRRLDELSALNAELKQTQQQLVQSEKLAAIGQLAAGVAHEINNPIGFVLSNLGSLENYFAQLGAVLEAYGEEEDRRRALSCPDSETAAWLERMARVRQDAEIEYVKQDLPALLRESRDGINRVRQIVADLRDFSRIDTGHQWERADLRKGLDSTLNIIASEIRYRAEVVKDYGELPKIRCLPAQLNQVFLNLLVNAAQAMPEDQRGTIAIRCSAHAAGVWVEIADTGAGIPPENLKRIFDPFYTTKPIGTGTGLGLALFWGIVQRHGGRIDVRSEVGVGTTFRVWLPIEPPESVAAN